MIRTVIVALLTTLALAQTPAPPQRPAPSPPADPPSADAHYKLAPDALPQDGVPVGEIKGPFTLPSEAYPGTQHTFWVYVPAQYDPKVAASLMIYNDGQAFLNPTGDMRAPVVMDNLIYRREIPVMIAVFINPGRRPDQPEPNQQEWGDRTTNRPTEYNTLDDKYARVIVDELLPVLYKDYNISKDPDRHCIGGSSSGAIAAFTVAWQRNDQFHKVLSNVGSFTNIRGGDAYPEIIRTTTKKNIRIFLVDGRNDNRALRENGAYDERRDWFLQNVRMQRALEEKGYELNYSWGVQRHGQKMLQTVFPEMMRWLWRDHGVATDPHDMVERAPKAAAGAAAPGAQAPAREKAIDPELTDAFFAAVRANDIPKVEELLAKGVDVNARFRYEQTALFPACDKGLTDMVRVLLAHGAKVDVSDTFYHATPMTWAASKGHAEIVKMLLEKGAKSKEGALSQGVQGDFPDVVKVALAAGEIKAEVLSSALKQATRDKHPDIVALLTAAGAVMPPAPDFKVDEATLQSYAGAYKSDAANAPPLSFVYRDGKLTGGVDGQRPLTLAAYSKVKFTAVEFDGVIFTFTVEDNKVTGLVLSQGGFTGNYKKVDAK